MLAVFGGGGGGGVGKEADANGEGRPARELRAEFLHTVISSTAKEAAHPHRGRWPCNSVRAACWLASMPARPLEHSLLQIGWQPSDKTTVSFLARPRGV